MMMIMIVLAFSVEFGERENHLISSFPNKKREKTKHLNKPTCCMCLCTECMPLRSFSVVVEREKEFHLFQRFKKISALQI